MAEGVCVTSVTSSTNVFAFLYRNYTSPNGTGKSDRCYLPVGQVVIVQYTTFATKSGQQVHRAVGVRVNRSYRNLTATSVVTLTTQVVFVLAETKMNSASR